MALLSPNGAVPVLLPLLLLLACCGLATGAETYYYGGFSTPALAPYGSPILGQTALVSGYWTDRAGSVFYRSPITFLRGGYQHSFSVSFTLLLMDRTQTATVYDPLSGMVVATLPVTPGADGLVFVISNDDQRQPGMGGFLGYNGTTQSLGIEFDLFQNPEVNDPAGDHIGINLNGNLASVQTYVLPQPINDGVLRTCWIDYDGTDRALKVYLATNTTTKPLYPILEYKVDLLDVVQSPTFKFGFTGSSGALQTSQRITSFQATLDGVSIVEIGPQSGFTSMQFGGSAQVTGAAIELAPAVPNSSGSAFFNRGLVYFLGAGHLSFSTFFTFQIDSDGQASGLPSASQSLTFLLATTLGATPGSPQALSLKIDTNAAQANQVTLASNGGATILAQAPLPAQFSVRALATVWLDYDGNSQTFSITLANGIAKPDAPIITQTASLNSILGQPTFFLGFWAQNGDNYASHRVNLWGITLQDTPLYCNSNPCLNGGRCDDLIDGFSCSCSVGFSGDNCQTNIDDCTPNPCLNGGVCVDGVNSFSCSCAGAYTGPVCNLLPTCDPTSDGVSSWNRTVALVTVTQTCPLNFVGNPVKLCQGNGTWAPTVNPCTPSPNCTAETFNLTIWGITRPNTVAAGACVPAWLGNPTRFCQNNGTWGPIINPCTAAPNCTASQLQFALFPLTAPNVRANGTCTTGFAGSPRRICMNNGTWNSTVDPPCVRITCNATILSGGSFPKTNAFVNATGTCLPGTAGSLQAPCLANGTWGQVTGSCTRNSNCSAEFFGNAAWTTTDPATNGTGNCTDGYFGTPIRACQGNGTWGAILVPCTIYPNCTAQTFANATWNITATSTIANGTCQFGYKGTPTRSCFFNGTWDSNVQSPCALNQCFAITENSISFPATIRDNVANGTCPPFQLGSPQRSCLTDGTWGPISGGCVTQNCSAVVQGGVSWPQAVGNTTVTGNCTFGTLGNPTRYCNPNGVWSTTVTGVCAKGCPTVVNYLNARFYTTFPGTNATGSCVSGFIGTPSLLCLTNGTWNSELWSPCSQGCASSYYNSATWPATLANTTATGVCNTGLTGAPQRNCTGSTWSTTVLNPCK